MATSPQFAGTINRLGVAVKATADVAVATSGSAITPTASSFATAFTPGASGSKIEEIAFVGTGTTLAGLIRVYVYDGTSYWLRDTVLVTAISNSTTAVPWSQVNTYTNLELKSTDSLVVSSTVASQLVNVIVTGGDL